MSRDGMAKGVLGDYSELIVAAAFMAEGVEVAFPFGNQHRWDMVIRRPNRGGWKTVQVKTIPRLSDGKSPIVSTTMQDKDKSPYTASDVDILIAVHPETGTLWMLTSDVFDGKRSIMLRDEDIWRGAVLRGSTPLAPITPIRIARKGVTAQRMADMKRVYVRKLEDQRAPVRAQLPVDRPEWCSVGNWEITKRWCSGDGYKGIGLEYAISPSAVRERIIRVLHRLSIRDLTDYMKKHLNKRKDRSRSALLLARVMAAGAVT